MDYLTAIFLIVVLVAYVIVFWKYAIPSFFSHCGVCQRLVHNSKAVRVIGPMGKFHFHKVCYQMMKHFSAWWLDKDSHEIHKDNEGKYWIVPVIHPTPKNDKNKSQQD